MGGFLREMKRKDRYGRGYSYWVAVKSYRDKKTGKVRHKVLKTFGRLTEREAENLKALWQLKEMGKDALVTTWEEIQVGASYEYLSIQILHRIFRLWELDKIFSYDRSVMVEWADIAEVLIINRVLCPNSDYKVSSWYPTTILPQLLNISPDLVNPTRIYRCLDEIYKREEQIQRHLFQKIPVLGVDNFSLIFYDITSTYFEGYKCEMAKFGLSRDHRKDRPQVLLALAVSKEGFPFFWRVLRGDIHDSSTVKEMVSTLREKFKVKDVCLVMDKGMVNRENLKTIEKENKGNIFYLVTIPKTSFRNLASFPHKILSLLADRLEKEMEGKEAEDIDYQKIMEGTPYFTYHSKRAYYHILEEKEEGSRYILCFNPEKFVEERRQRAEKIESVEERFREWNKELLNAKKSRNKERIEREVFAYLERRKVQGLFSTRVIKRKSDKKLQIKWKINTEKLDLLKSTDGCYCIKTNLPEETGITAEFLVSSYRQRRKVEVAFSYLKGFVDIRPLYHHKEERVKAHITICILAYLLEVFVEHLLKKAGYHISFQEFISQLLPHRAVELEIKRIKKKEIRKPYIPEEIKKIVLAVAPDLFA